MVFNIESITQEIIIENKTKYNIKAKHNAKFKVGDAVTIVANLTNLMHYFVNEGVYNNIDAKKEALLLLVQNNINVIKSYDVPTKGIYYCLQSEDIMSITIPEEFIIAKLES